MKYWRIFTGEFLNQPLTIQTETEQNGMMKMMTMMTIITEENGKKT